jgi:hypothetical protein
MPHANGRPPLHSLRGRREGPPIAPAFCRAAKHRISSTRLKRTQRCGVPRVGDRHGDRPRSRSRLLLRGGVECRNHHPCSGGRGHRHLCHDRARRPARRRQRRRQGQGGPGDGGRGGGLSALLVALWRATVSLVLRETPRGDARGFCFCFYIQAAEVAGLSRCAAAERLFAGRAIDKRSKCRAMQGDYRGGPSARRERTSMSATGATKLRNPTCPRPPRGHRALRRGGRWPRRAWYRASPYRRATMWRSPPSDNSRTRSRGRSP